MEFILHFNRVFHIDLTISYNRLSISISHYNRRTDRALISHFFIRPHINFIDMSDKES
jgi:hypothetical protein